MERCINWSKVNRVRERHDRVQSLHRNLANKISMICLGQFMRCIQSQRVAGRNRGSVCSKSRTANKEASFRDEYDALFRNHRVELDKVLMWLSLLPPAIAGSKNRSAITSMRAVECGYRRRCTVACLADDRRGSTQFECFIQIFRTRCTTFLVPASADRGEHEFQKTCDG